MSRLGKVHYAIARQMAPVVKIDNYFVFQMLLDAVIAVKWIFNEVKMTSVYAFRN
jgi:hypothetical protein